MIGRRDLTNWHPSDYPVRAIEWVYEQEALPGEGYALRWRVPDDATVLVMDVGVIISRGEHQRLHPWGRVKWIVQWTQAALDARFDQAMERKQ